MLPPEVRRPKARPGFPVLAGPPLLVAHRGGAALAPENTLEAFGRAVEWWGADMIELDVRLSLDGRVVVMHDETVDRTTDGTGPVAGLTLKELRSLDAGYRFRDLDGQASFRGKGVRVPTLDEVLEGFPGTRITVEAKASGVAEAAVELITRHGSEHRVILGAAEAALGADSAGFEGAVSATRQVATRFWMSHRLPKGGPYTPPVDILQIPTRWRGLSVVSRRLVRCAHDRNIAVQVWTINEPDEMRLLLEMGVDGIQSDRPDLLGRVLEAVVGRPPAPGAPEHAVPPGRPPQGPAARCQGASQGYGATPKSAAPDCGGPS